MVPRVSVVIPAFNVARYVAGAVESVLRQTYSNVEIVVVDDGSTDETADVAGRFAAVRVVRQHNQGVSVARDRGAAETSGDVLAFLDADDEWLPRKLEVQLARLDARPEIVASFVGSVGINERSGAERAITYRLPQDVRALAFGPIVGNASSVAIRRSAFDAVGGFDPAFSQSADWDMWIRLAALGPLDYHPEPLVRVRLGRPHSLTRDVELLERDVLGVLDKFFASPAGHASADTRSRVYASHYLTLAASYAAARRPMPAARCLVRSLIRRPAGLLWVLGTPLRRARRRVAHGAGRS